MIVLLSWLPMWILVTLGLVAVILWLLILRAHQTFEYWERKGVRSVGRPVPFLGSAWRVMILKEHLAEFFNRAYQEAGDEPFVGYFQGQTPSLIVRSPDLARQILVKDFDHFTDHGFKVDKEADPLEALNLFNLEGHRWKEMRTKLSPTFTSGRIKAMLPLMLEVALNFEKLLGKLAETGESFEVKEVISRYTTDVIASCAFGVNCDSINEPNHEFREMGRRLVTLDFLAKKLKISAFIDRELTEYFRKMVRDVVNLRNETGQTRKDFLQLLIELKTKGRLQDEEEHVEVANGVNGHLKQTSNIELTEDDLVAQATVFFLAGFETSSTLLSFALLELAMRPELQKRARQEIEEVLERHGGKVTYEAMLEMKYLDCIAQESMRKYPPALNIMRICTKNYIIPNTMVTIEEGTPIMIPAQAIQNDPNNFADPERFDPDRFADDKKYPYLHIPFGEGPRQCIGMRFALLQSKLGLMAALRRFQVHPCSRTLYPVQIEPAQFVLSNKGGIWVTVSRVSNEE